MYSQRPNGVPGMTARTKGQSLLAPFKNQDLVLGSLTKVYITHISNPEKFHVQLDSSTDTLAKLVDHIHGVYNGIGPNDHVLKCYSVGQACIAMFDEDYSWYRAKIIGMSGDKLIEVLFVDYGNTELVAPQKVKAITPDLLNLPAQSVICALSGVAPSQGFWPPEHIAQFEDIALSQSFTACFKSKRKEDQMYLVKLISDSGEMINETFGVKTNSVCLEEEVSFSKRQIQIDNSGDKVQVTVSKPQNGVTAMGDMSSTHTPAGISTVKLRKGESLDVSVIYAESPSRFFCQAMKLDADLNVITQKLLQYDKVPENVNVLRNPMIGTLCAAKFKGDDVWYRARITEIRGTSAHVFFVDFGNSEDVDFSELRALTPDLQNLPFYALECMLENVRPSDKVWSDQCREEFELLVYDKEIEMKILDIEDQLNIVTLTDSVEGSDIGQKLISARHATSSHASQVVVPYSKLQIPIPSKSQIFVSWTENPEHFWIQLSDNQDILDNLTENLQNYCETDGLRASNVKPGEAVLAKFTEDEAWYRGVIQSLTGSKATVLFVDYGNTDSLSTTNLLKVSPEYLKTPSLALLCKFKNIQPTQNVSSWIEDAKTILDDFTVDGALAKFLDKDGDQFVVELFVGQENVEDHLIKAGVASRKSGQGPAPSSSGFPNSVGLAPKQLEKTYVSHVDSVHQFWCQLSKHTTSLDEIMEKMEAFYSQGEGQPMTPVAGSACAAKYSADDAWYRAEVLKFDGSNVEVFFVDYGNCDTVSPSNVCKLGPEFLNLPKQAMQCRLAIDNADGSLTEKLQNIVEEKELVLKVQAVSGSIHKVDLLEDSQSVSTMLLSAAKLPRQPVLPPPRVQFKPINVKIGKPVTAYASCIVSPGKLYLQMAGTDDQLSDISQNLKAYCSTCDVAPEIQEGDGCAGLFAEDSEWYRAKVMTIRGSEVKVLFVDYGNAEFLQKEGLRPLPSEVVDIPPFGIECSLDDLAPVDGSDWTAESTEFLETLILDQELNCGFVSSAAVIITVNGEDIGDKLVNAGHAKRISAPPMPKEYEFPSKPDGEVKGYITHIDPDGVFYVQLSSTEREIVKLAELMQREGKTASKLSPKVSVEKGLTCISKFKVDKNWYRVRVESADGSKVTVRFVDYGNCEEERSDDLKQLTLEMMKAPVQAFPCKIKNLTDWNQDFQDRLNEMTEELTFTFASGSQPFDVEVKTKRGKDVANLIMNPPRPRVFAKQIKPIDDVQAYISHVEKDNSFYIQFSDHTETINEMSTTLAEFPVEEVPERLTSKYACAAMFSEDQAWYRAIVTKLGPKVHVHFVDFGNGDDLPVDKLKELPEDILDVPPYAFHCKIDGVQTWSQAAKDLFDSYTEKEMTVKFLSDSTPFLVQLICEDHNLSRILNRAEVTSYLKPVINNQLMQGAVCHTESNGKFYLHLQKNDEVLDILGAELQDYFSSEQSEVAYDLQKGQPCVAKFSEDESWYRAVVEEITKEKVHVRFVDFGNAEEANPSDVKFMENQFLKHPPLAYECQLNNAGKWTEKKQQKFTEMTEGKDLNIQFVTNIPPYMVNVTRSLADVLQEEADESVAEETEEKADTTDAGALLDFPPQSPFNEPGFICHIESDGTFYVHLESEENRLTNLSEKLQDHYSKSSEPLDELTAGKICAAKFTEDDMWYRAKVEKIKGDEVKVRFADYGNVDTVTTDRVKKLRAEDISHPPLAYKCNLRGLENWTEEVNKEFQNLTDDQTLIIKFFQADGGFSIELVNENGDDIFTMVHSKTGKQDSDSNSNQDAEGSENKERKSEIDLQEREKTAEQNAEVDVTTQGTDQQDSGLVESLPETESSTREQTEGQGVEEIILKTEAEIVESSEIPEPTSVVFIQNKLKEGSRLSVTVSHSIHPNDFYIQPETSVALLEKLTTEMYDYYNGLAEGEELVATPVVHEPVAVLYSEDESWYRARVEAVADDKCDVFYVDHGNLESVSIASLRRLCPKFVELPIQAVECSLAGVQPIKYSWTDDAIEQFAELTQDKELVADVIKVGESGNCLVHLLNQGLSISQDLINKHHGVSADTPVSISKKIKRVFSDSQSPAKRIKMNELTDSILEFEEGKRLKCISSQLHKQESIHAIVSYTESPSKFWCQFTFATDALASGMEQLQTAYSSRENIPFDEDLSIDDIAVIQASDGKFYRAAIQNIQEENLRVRLVDYGRLEDVPKDKVFILKDEFYKFPSQAARCCLHNMVSPGNTWQQNSCDRFAELVKDKKLIMFVKRVLVNCLAVELFDGETSIRETMVTESLAKYDDSVESSDEEEFDHFGVTVPEIQIFDESASESRKDYKDLEEDTEYELIIDVETFDPTMFSATVQYDEKTQKVMDGIEALMEKRDTQKKEDESWRFSVGDPCLAFTSDGWSRARIVEINEDKVKVYLVDVGNNEELTVSAIAEIPVQYVAIPPQLIICRIGEILPVTGDTWSEEAVQYMKDYLKEKTISAYILSKGDDEVYSVSLVDSSDIDSSLLNKLLVETGLARVIPNSQLEIQLQMESDLNDTDKMGELEASFQDVSFLRENSLDEDLMDEKPKEDNEQTEAILDNTTANSVEAEGQDKTEADSQNEDMGGETEADNQSEAKKDETEAKTESDEDENEAAESEQEVKIEASQNTASESEALLSESDVKNSDNPSDKAEADASKTQKEADDNKEATDVENEVTEDDKNASGDINEDIKETDDKSSDNDSNELKLPGANGENSDPENES
ncbi:hypothetical protein LOTGIDRAFT_157854 [Lottia gigantea]|uniref:Tudor domain-containing protein n=1 Tax=Lottia gigantea TaxID=225164 RepID=V4ATG3_LOTGI|nr:hypothetical protein LOTGIDRAFT_157854 [Lottia gigantea]ESP00578.1 hypothetical protein LOTGIDRAFT_157854 [Lottia gigantea]